LAGENNPIHIIELKKEKKKKRKKKMNEWMRSRSSVTLSEIVSFPYFWLIN